MPGFALLLWFVHATWCYLKGALERERRIKARWHRGPTLLFALCSVGSPRLSDVIMSVRQPSPKTNPRPSPSDLLSRPSSVVTLHTAHRRPYGSIQGGLAETCWPHMEPSPQGVTDLGQLVGVCGTCELDDRRWFSPRFCVTMMWKH